MQAYTSAAIISKHFTEGIITIRIENNENCVSLIDLTNFEAKSPDDCEFGILFPFAEMSTSSLSLTLEELLLDHRKLHGRKTRRFRR